jgi:hypothetical protein
MSPSLYREWKRDLVIEALKREGVSAKVEELVDAHGAGRRRATFHARFPHGRPDEVGFMRARSHDIIAIDDCPLFSPGMAGAIQAARALSGDLRGLMKPLDIGIAATLDGLDVDLRGSGPLQRVETQKLTRTADALDLARVSNHGEVVIERRPPRVAFGDTLARLPPAGDRGRRKMAGRVCRGGARRHEKSRGPVLRRGRIRAEACARPRGLRRRFRSRHDRRACPHRSCKHGPAHYPRRDARPLPPSATGGRTRRVRRGADRSAPGWRAPAGARASGLLFATRRIDLMQCGDLRPRRARSH